MKSLPKKNYDRGFLTGELIAQADSMLGSNHQRDKNICRLLHDAAQAVMEQHNEIQQLQEELEALKNTAANVVDAVTKQ